MSAFDAGLARVAQPQDGGTDAALGEFAQRLGARREVGEGPRAVRRRGGQRPDAHRDLGDDPERALRPQEELSQVGSCGARGGTAQAQLADRGRDAQGVHEVVEASVAARGLTARARRGVAADRGVLEALREVAERVAPCVEQLFGLRTGRARRRGWPAARSRRGPTARPCARDRARSPASARPPRGRRRRRRSCRRRTARPRCRARRTRAGPRGPRRATTATGRHPARSADRRGGARGDRACSCRPGAACAPRRRS